MTLSLPLLLLTLALTPPEPGAVMPAEPSAATARAVTTDTLAIDGFRIVYTPRAQGSARLLARELPLMRALIREGLGRDWDGVTEVRVGLGREEYEALALPGSRPPPWAVALAWPEANVVLVDGHSLTRADGQSTLRHELVHVALGRVGSGWPRWFQEGLAQHLTGERQFRIEHYATLARAVSGDRVYHFRDLTDGFPSHADDVQVAYAQSAAFVGFLVERHGKAGLGRLLDAVAQGDVFETAFGKAYKSPLSLEEQAFRDDLPSRYSMWPLVTGGTTLWVLLSLVSVVAWARRRSVVKAHRARLLEAERLEDAAAAVVGAFHRPANDDDWLEAAGPQGRTPPWLVSVVRVRGGDDEAAPTPARAPGT